jgi:small subunit ribosomal protein S3
MGQKVRPIGLRLSINRTWDSRWFAEKKDYSRFLLEDLNIRSYITKSFFQAGISRVIIERPAKKPCITIYSSRPGLIIGKKGVDIDNLRKKISRMTNVDNVSLNIIEIRKPEVDARLIAENISNQIVRRLSYRRAMKRAIQQAVRMGVEGIRVKCSGRLAGAEIARSEEYREGRVPLHTLRADVDYACVPAHTTYGVTGVKVWVFKGEIMEHNPMAHEQRLIAHQSMR